MNPWLKWYPTNWRADPALRLCSLAARGLWIELLGYMHEAEPYGHLLVSGKPPTPKQIASLVGVDARIVAAALQELIEAGVPSINEAGVMFSRRMVRDKAKADADIANGKRGGNPKLGDEVKGGVNPPHNPTVNGVDKAQKLEARSQIPEGKAKAARKRAIPPDFAISDRVATWADGKGYGDLAQYLDAFVCKAKAKGYTYVDWDAALMTSIREDWGGIRAKPKPINGTSVHDKRAATAAAMYANREPHGNDQPTDITGAAERIA